MNYKEKLYQVALDQFFKSKMYSATMVKTAVDIVIGDDGFRSKEVIEVLKYERENEFKRSKRNNRRPELAI